MTMDEFYLTKQNMISKPDEWLNILEISHSREKKFKFKPENSALLVIDMQDFFLNKNSHAFIPSAKTIVPNINSLIEKYRRQSCPIIFTFHAYQTDEEPGIMDRWWGDVLRVNNPWSDIHSSIEYDKNDIKLRKNRYSAFINTNLDQMLSDNKINKLVITGVMTHLCCESTARDAFMRDYEVYFVVDATATDNEELHLSSLKTLTDGFVMPVKTKTILEGET
jgi:isochorismate hydrolase